MSATSLIHGGYGIEFLATVVSDIHLRHTAPISRAEKDDEWYKVMKGYLDQLTLVSELTDTKILCTGDVFHKWNSPAQLINFAIEHMPRVYAVPGQHDLPNHRYEDIQKSAYWTLVKAGKIINLNANKTYPIIKLKEPKVGNYCLLVNGYSWNMHLSEAWDYDYGNSIPRIAIVHKYIWKDQATCYPGAPEDNKARKLIGKLKGYDLAAFGDNHIGFVTEEKGVPVMNCGGLYRSKSDEKNYKPMVGVAYRYEDEVGFMPVYLDASKDKWEDDLLKGIMKDAKDDDSMAKEIEGFMDELNQGADTVIDFHEKLERFVSHSTVTQSVKDKVTSIIERVKK